MATLSRNDLIRRIQDLPQARFIPEDRMHRWLDGVARTQPGREAWLIARLNGFGGSEIGVLVGEQAEMFDPFSSARSIVADKLLLNEPDMPTADTTRGTVLEPVIAQVFLNKYNAVRDNEALTKIAAYRGDPDHPWLVGNPDDVVWVDQARYLADYKCPKAGTAEHYAAAGIPFGYACQLHHYRMIGRRVGIDFDGLILAPFDTNLWDVLAQEVLYDPALDREILRCGDLYWNEYVLQGEIPDFPDNAREILYLEDLPEKVHETAEVFASLNILANTAHREALQRKELLQHMLGPYQPAIRQRIPVGGVNVDGGEKAEFDVDAMCAELEARNISIDDCITRTEYDATKLYSKLEQMQAQDASLDLTPYRKVHQTLAVGVSRAKKGPVGEYVQGLRQRSDAVVESVIQCAIEALPATCRRSTRDEPGAMSNPGMRIKTAPSTEMSRCDSENPGAAPTGTSPAPTDPAPGINC